MYTYESLEAFTSYSGERVDKARTLRQLSADFSKAFCVSLHKPQHDLDF